MQEYNDFKQTAPQPVDLPCVSVLLSCLQGLQTFVSSSTDQAAGRVGITAAVVAAATHKASTMTLRVSVLRSCFAVVCCGVLASTQTANMQVFISHASR
jgi:hypothetical protein